MLNASNIWCSFDLFNVQPTQMFFYFYGLKSLKKQRFLCYTTSVCLGVSMQNASSWIELSRSAFYHNVAQYRALIGPNVEMMVIAKANAYGHGLLPIGSLCQEHPEINAVGVFLLSDAYKLLDAGFSKPIFVMGCLDADLDRGIAQGIEFAAIDKSSLQQLNARAVALGLTAKIHLKVDSGLSRLGFLPHEVLSIVQQILTDFTNLHIVALWSHFSESDALNDWFTRQQYEQFMEVANTVRQMVPYPIKLHLANSTATARFTDKQLDMVRVAGGIWGFAKSDEIQQDIRRNHPAFELKPLLTWKSRVMAIKQIESGAFISYARTCQVTRPTITAVIPVGYYDGYPRSLSNQGSVLVNGKLAPILGRVCMNMTIVDITDIPDITIDDEVIVLGPYEGVSVRDHERITNTIGYEILNRINPALPRVVVEDVLPQPLFSLNDKSVSATCSSPFCEDSLIV